MTAIFAVSLISMQVIASENNAELATKAELISSHIFEALVSEAIVEALAVVNKSNVKNGDHGDSEGWYYKGWFVTESGIPGIGKMYPLSKSAKIEDKPQFIRFHNDGLHPTFIVPKWLDDSSNK